MCENETYLGTGPCYKSVFPLCLLHTAFHHKVVPDYHIPGGASGFLRHRFSNSWRTDPIAPNRRSLKYKTEKRRYNCINFQKTISVHVRDTILSYHNSNTCDLNLECPKLDYLEGSKIMALAAFYHHHHNVSN